MDYMMLKKEISESILSEVIPVIDKKIRSQYQQELYECRLEIERLKEQIKKLEVSFLWAAHDLEQRL